jgi:hypothetical protein
MARREVTGKKPGVSADLIERGSGPPDPEDDDPEDDDPARDKPARDKPERDKPERDEPTKHKEPAARASATLPPIRGPPPLLALSILEFCAAFGISEDFFYKLKRQGQAPRLMKVGKRTMISMEAANEWRIEREAASAKAEA